MKGRNTYQLRVNVQPDDGQFVEKLSEGTGLSMAEICTIVLKAGLKTLKAEGPRLVLPIKFSLNASENYYCNETPAPAPCPRPRSAHSSK